MGGDDDPDDVLHHLVSAELAERLLDGTIASDDVPHRVTDVAELFDALRAPVSADERADAARAATVFAGRVRAGTATSPDTTRTPMQPHAHRLRAKAVAAIAAAVVLSAGTAAAATGSLPDAAQSGISNALSHVGIEIPHPDDAGDVLADDEQDEESTTTTTTLADPVDEAVAPAADVAADSTTTTLDDAPTAAAAATAVPVGPDPNGPARHGLCTAYVASGAATKPNGESVAMRALADAAAAAGQTVEEFCADAPEADDSSGTADTPTSDGSQSPSDTAPGRSDDSPSATAPGHSSDSPSATAPDRGRDLGEESPESADRHEPNSGGRDK
ncbi:MAG: hypothetical protein AB7Q42_16450 [Acidimicrobiia bacterium]